MWSDTQRIRTQLLSFLGIFAPFICFHFTIYCKVHSLITDQGCVKWWPLSLFAFMENRFPRNCWSNISALGANCCRLIKKTFIQRMISFVVDNNWQWLTMVDNVPIGLWRGHATVERSMQLQSGISLDENRCRGNKQHFKVFQLHNVGLNRTTNNKNYQTNWIFVLQVAHYMITYYLPSSLFVVVSGFIGLKAHFI